MMFEPFNPRMVSAFSRFNYFHYMDPAEEDEALSDYCARIFSGQFQHPWVDRQIEFLRPKGRLIKEIRANLFLAWIKRRFAEIPILLLIRHPCAVALSRMQLQWDTDEDILSCLSQQNLMQGYLNAHSELIDGVQTDEEKHAIIWCIHHLIPLRQMSSADRTIIFYENLCLEPEQEIERVLGAINMADRTSLLDKLARPSATSKRHSAILSGRDLVRRWQRELSSKQIDRILRIVSGFKLDFLYGESAEPKVDSEFTASEYFSST